MALLQRALGKLASALPGNLAVRFDDQPICSFTFDDCPTSALETAGAMLEAAGTGGTFCICARAAQRQTLSDCRYLWGDDLVRAQAAGHEIACHTYTHPFLSTLPRTHIERELDDNLRAIREFVPHVNLTSFSYPFGDVSVAAKACVANRFAVGRGIRWGLNGRVVDLAELRACCIRSVTFRRDRITRLVANAVRRRAWVVFAAHDVTAHPSEWGCTPEEFNFVLQTVQDAGVEILPLRAAVGRITHRQPYD